VEVREGGEDGVSRRWEFGDEERALDAVRALLAREEDWREIAVRPRY
jgi:hypothetical protein